MPPFVALILLAVIITAIATWLLRTWGVLARDRRSAAAWIVTVVVLAVAGASLNVAVAWWCVLLDDNDFPVEHAAAELTSEEIVEVMTGRSRGATLVSRKRCKSHRELFAHVELGNPYALLPSWARFDRTRAYDEAPTPTDFALCESRVVIAYGFPLRSLWSDEGGGRWREATFDVDSEQIPRAGYIGSDDYSGPRFPIRPAWFGFGFNTACYAGLVLMPVVSVRLVRGRVRRRRHLCARCGYPRGESSTCSECGATLP